MASSAVIWVLSLHVAAMLVWCGTQLLLLALIKGVHTHQGTDAPSPLLLDNATVLPRWLFTRLTTPAALLAITSGTAVFLMNHTIEAWLLLKLGLVSMLVVVLTLTGLLLLAARELPAKRIGRYCNLLLVSSASLMTAILWTVLAKPHAGLLP